MLVLVDKKISNDQLVASRAIGRCWMYTLLVINLKVAGAKVVRVKKLHDYRSQQVPGKIQS